MKIHETSRRQDLLVGSLVPTLILCAAVWFDQGHRLQAIPTNRPVPPAQKPFYLPPDPVDVVVPGDPVKAKVLPEAVPDIPDTPQPINAEHMFIQPIEPPLPDARAVVATIPNSWGSKGSAFEVFNPDMLDQPPAVIRQARPVYPYDMREKGYSGSVMVDFIVDPDGNVRNATAVRSSMPEFAPSAVAAVSKWKFKAGRKANHAVFTHMQVPIEFTLDNSSQ
jgi:protein TonB